MYVLEGEGKVERGKKIRKVVKLSVQRKHSFLHCFFFFFFFFFFFQITIDSERNDP